MNIDLKKLPSLELHQYRDLPNISGVYIIISGKKVQYIGRASNISRRFPSHHRMSQFLSMPNPKIYWIAVEEKTLGVRRIFNKFFKPLSKFYTCFSCGKFFQN
jgi:hypothetical protein